MARRLPPSKRPGRRPGPPEWQTIGIQIRIKHDPGATPAESLVALRMAVAEKADVIYLKAKRLGGVDFVVCAQAYDFTTQAIDRDGHARVLIAPSPRLRELDHHTSVHPGEYHTKMLAEPAAEGKYTLLVANRLGFYTWDMTAPDA